MLLMTVQAKDGYPIGVQSTADASGLSAYLGYRPMFCTMIDPNSLVDTWFRIATASPMYVEVIDVFDVPEEEAVPQDVVKWVNVGFDRRPWPLSESEFESILAPGDKLTTDWLLSPDKKPSWRFDVWDMVNGRFESMCKDGETVDALHLTMERLGETLLRSTSLESGGCAVDFNNMSIEDHYRVINRSGIVPFIWSTVCGTEVPKELVSMHPIWLMQNESFDTYQELMSEWDESMNDDVIFDFGSFYKMHDAFVRASDKLAHKVAEEAARTAHIGRNDTCFCGSGRKYKKCCARKGLDELVGLST